MTKSKVTYHQALRAELAELIDELDLSELHKHSMKARWLDQVIWTDKKAAQSQQRYYFLRLTTVIGGVIIPALVAFNNFSLDIAPEQYIRSIFPVALFSFTQMVAICTAVEEFFQYGVRWRQYRTTAESLKSEGWQFFQLSGAYRKAKNHTKAYPTFSTRIERIIRRDVQTYLSEISKEQQREEDDTPESSGNVAPPLSPLHSGFFSGIPTSIEPTHPPIMGVSQPLGPDEVPLPSTPDPRLGNQSPAYGRPPMPPPNPRNRDRNNFPQ